LSATHVSFDKSCLLNWINTKRGQRKNGKRKQSKRERLRVMLKNIGRRDNDSGHPRWSSGRGGNWKKKRIGEKICIGWDGVSVTAFHMALLNGEKDTEMEE